VDVGLTRTLFAMTPRDAQRLSLVQFAPRMAQLYGDMDYWHPFVEGNSRTLRTFTRQWARQAGFVLDWGLSKHTAATRDRLYMGSV
jgi:cell filamentation protein